MKRSKPAGIVIGLEEVVNRTLDIVPVNCSPKVFCKEFKKVAQSICQEKYSEIMRQKMKDEHELNGKNGIETNEMKTKDVKSKLEKMLKKLSL